MARRGNVLVSVIIPVFNAVKYLDDCLESVVLQTYENLEIILVDDASTDGSGEKCDQWAQKDARIKVIHKTKNEGSFLARISGFESMHGEYFISVDSDDFIGKEYVQELLQKIKDSNADIVVRSTFTSLGDDNEGQEVNVPRLYSSSDPLGNFIKVVAEGGRVFGWTIWNKIYRTSVYKSSRQFLRSVNNNIGAGDDLLCMVAFLYHTKKIAQLSGKNGYFYRQNSSSMMKQMSRDSVVVKLRDITTVLHYIEKFLAEVGLQGKYRAELDAITKNTLSDHVSAIENGHIREINALKETNTRLQDTIVNLQRDMEEIINSRTYRIGKTIVYPLVMLRKVVKAVLARIS